MTGVQTCALPISVLEADDVVEMRRRDLDDQRVLDRGDPVDGARAVAERVAGGDLETIEIGPGDCFRYRPGTVHRVTALEDTTILEVSTPHLDDVVRLDDRYGRPERDV